MPTARSGRRCRCGAGRTWSGRGGCWQSFADLLKFVFKEPIIPAGANKGIFLLAPLVTAGLALSAWAVIPVAEGWEVADLNVGILFIFAISSLQVYGVIMAGWASNSKYAFLAALRSAAQMVSYEVSIGFVIITVLLCAGSLNLSDIVEAQDSAFGLFGWYWLPLFPMFVVFFISALAETNRPPFDLLEAESELVAGFMVEYSSTPYMLFMLGEYVAIVLMCGLGTVLFLGGWLPPFPVPPFTWIPGVVWFLSEGLLPVLPDRHGQSHGAALPLRSADAARLEGLPAPVARHGRDRGGGPASSGSTHPKRRARVKRFAEAAKSLLLMEFLSAFWLAMKYFVAPQGDASTTPSRRGRSRPASAASMRCGVIPTARSAASPASSARPSVRPRPSPSRPGPAATTARAAPPATTSTW